MTDLAKGIIEVEGFNLKPGMAPAQRFHCSNDDIITFGKFAITPQTTSADLLSAYSAKLSPVSNQSTQRFKMLFWIDGSRFSCAFHFDESGLISRIKMSPDVEYKSENWDRTGQQEERRQFCDAWLYERLGEPHKDLSGDIEYTFSNVSISCFSNFDIHNGADAGYIVVEYLR